MSGCERSEEEPLALLTLDKERIVFDNPAEGETAQAVLRIEADRRWSVGFIGNGHDCRVSVLSGEAGVHELRIETSETNTGRDLHRLGQLTVALDDGSANRTVDLQQRPQAARQTLLMYFCGTDLYSYYKNNLSDVAKALSRNILPLGRIVAFTQPAAGEGYVVEYRYDEAANACERDTLIRYTPLPGRTTDPAVMERILGDMAAAGRERMRTVLGSAGETLWTYAMGLDESRVRRADEAEPPKSIGCGTTFAHDLRGEREVRAGLLPLCDRVGTRLRMRKLYCTTVQVQIRDPFFKTISRQQRLAAATNVTRELYETAVGIVLRCRGADAPIRMLTVTASGLTDRCATQMRLIDDVTQARLRDEALDGVMDDIRARYGPDAISFCRTLRPGGEG